MVAAPVNVQVDILSLQPVDILNMKLELTIKITLVWRDPRVDMESLNYDDNLNVILESSEVRVEVAWLNVWRFNTQIELLLKL